MTRRHDPSAAAIAEIALDQFTERRRALRRAVDQGDWPGDPANENAQLWLAIALAAGAGPMLPADVKAQIEIACVFPPGRRTLPEADDIAPRREWLAELARARDVAFARADGSESSDRLQRAFDYDALAEALGAPAPQFPKREERNAA